MLKIHRALFRVAGFMFLAQMPTAAEVAEKWARRGQSASGDYQAGVDRVTTAPGEAAAQKADKWYQGITEAHTSGRWARRVRSVDLNTWKQRTKEIGGSRYSQGVAAAQPKMEQAMARILPIIDSVRTKVRAMPDATRDDRIARAVAFMRELSDRARTS